MAFSPKQADFLANSTHSFNIQVGAVSSGKTFSQVVRWYAHLYGLEFQGQSAPEGALMLMSGKTQESLYDNVIRDLVKLADSIHPGDLSFRTGPYRGRLKSRNLEIAIAGADDERSWGRIQGKTVFGWLADEITQHPESFVKMAQSRCRGEGRVWPKFWTANPDVPEHFVKVDYIDNSELDVATWDFLMTDNPVNTAQYIEELRASYSGVYEDRYIRGLWVRAEGMVYPEFDREVSIIHDFTPPREWEQLASIDFGYTNPFVYLAGCLDPDGRLYVFAEHYQAKMLIGDHALAIKEIGVPRKLPFADHDAQDAAELQAAGVPSQPAEKAVEIGIQRVKARFKKAGDGKPRLFIDARCKNLIRELGLYHWDRSAAQRGEKEVPAKVDDHGPDALRYMVMGADRPSTTIPNEQQRRKPATAGMRGREW